MTAVLERPITTTTEEERPAWLASEEALKAVLAGPREVNTGVYVAALLAGDRPLMRYGKDVRVTPLPDEKPVSERSWVKVTAPHAERSSHEKDLPKVMRLWFAALERCDSDGRADFDSGELAKILGCAERTVRDAIAQGKRCGQIRERSDARHVYLIGVTNDRPSARRVATKRRIEETAHQYATTRPRTSKS